MRHLLLTNDFPPKVGGIQSYLWQLWRRLPAEETFVWTTPHRAGAAFDAEQAFTIGRSRGPVLLPNPVLLRRVNRLLDELDIDLVLVDPAFPLGLMAPWLSRPYGVVLHGAEVTVPARLPLSGAALGRVLRQAEVVISAGHYPAAEAERCAGRPLPLVVVPPGVDVSRFQPLALERKAAVRQRYGLDQEDFVVVSVSRLVPRKGMDVLIRATAQLRWRHPSLRVLIGGKGRDENRLRREILGRGAPVELVGFVDEDDLPALYGCADAFAMLCRSRWLGLEQEGFGIVFTEAAACGVPALSGRSGGAHEAVEHGVTGLVIEQPASTEHVANGLRELITDNVRRTEMGQQARRRAVSMFDYDHLAGLLHQAIVSTCDRIAPRKGDHR